MMRCLACGQSGAPWPGDSRFCSQGCYERFEEDAGEKTASRKPQTLDDVIFDVLVADYPHALGEWGKRAESDIAHYRHPERAEIYAEHLMRTPFGIGHGIGLRAAHSDYAPEYPPVPRTPLQERLRAKIAKWIAPTFKSFQADRADAYARARVDLLDPWAREYAVAAAVQARPRLGVSDAERRAFEEEERYETGRRR